ncbi:unnamed protein product [Effrenium voratum]|uniref:Uncharacterized protein n=1 Tax=Effrenium voratum TaxID=2562239 RepID=A0AA36NJH9_9DINO|nr:unnamed protein product [Effrenium voratum]
MKDWPATKAALLRAAKMPVRKMLSAGYDLVALVAKSPRRQTLEFASRQEPFDSSLPLKQLVERLQRHANRVKRGVMWLCTGACRAMWTASFGWPLASWNLSGPRKVLTANDLLELCGGSVAKASKEVLEATLRQVLGEVSDGRLDTSEERARFAVSRSAALNLEDDTALEVMQKPPGIASGAHGHIVEEQTPRLDSEGVRAAPVLALPDSSPSRGTAGASASGALRIIAQFDLADEVMQQLEVGQEERDAIFAAAGKEE